MKNILVIYINLSLFFLICCSKKNSASENEYYVKYVIDGRSSIQQNSPTGLKVTLINEGKVAVDYIRPSRGSNEFTIGPVKKGFIASLAGLNMCPVTNSCYTFMDLQIFISQNNGPFVLKKEDVNSATYRNTAQITYTIE
jgi:hypothetical protein